MADNNDNIRNWVTNNPDQNELVRQGNRQYASEDNDIAQAKEGARVARQSSWDLQNQSGKPFAERDYSEIGNPSAYGTPYIGHNNYRARGRDSR